MIGKWVRCSSCMSEVIGVVDDTRMQSDGARGSEPQPYILIRNAQGLWWLPVASIICEIDPVQTWNKLRPGEPLSEWLQQELDHANSNPETASR